MIGMGSVVTKDIGPYEIWAGNPARIIRKRMPDEQIAALQKMQWWNWPDEKIQAHAQLFNNVEAFLEDTR